jgi:hypothetical protein
VVSATNLSGQYLAQPDGYGWLLRYPRTGMLDHAVQVFKVNEPGHEQTVESATQ